MKEDFGTYRIEKEPIDMRHENQENDLASNETALAVRDAESGVAIPATGEPQSDVPHGFHVGDTVIVERFCCPDGPEGQLPTRHPERYTGTIKRFGDRLAMVYIDKTNGGVGVVHWDDCKVIK